MSEAPPPIRILFVFAWLVVGGEETEVRLLARHLDRKRYRIDVLACFRKEGMPDQTHAQLAAEGVHVDTTAYALSFEDTVAYLARRLPGYDLVVSCQNVADIYPALERLRAAPAADRARRPRLRGPRRPEASHRPLRRRLRQHPRRRRRADARPRRTTRSRSPRWSIRPSSTPPAARRSAPPSASPPTRR